MKVSIRGSRPARALSIAAAILAAVILVGTAITLLGRGGGGKDAAASRPAAPAIGTAVFEGIGDLRIQSADGAALALRVGLEYPAAAADLAEELLAKKAELRRAVTAYLSSKKKGDLDPVAMGALKASVLDLINGDLVTGKVAAVLFSDYGFVE